MKTNLILCLAVGGLFLLGSCKKDNTEGNDQEQKYNVNATLKVAIQDSKANAKGIRDSLFEYAFEMLFTTHFNYVHHVEDLKSHANATRTLSGPSYYPKRDTVTRKFIFFGPDVVTIWHQGGPLILGYMLLTENIILRAALDSNGNYINPCTYYFEPVAGYDTIGYIPNAVVQDGRAIAEKAIAEKDFPTLYSLLDSHYQFIPISGKEYTELVKQGKH